MAETYSRRISIYVDSGQALAAQEQLIANQAALTKKLDDLKVKSKEAYEKYVADPSKKAADAVKKLGNEMDATKAAMERNSAAIDRQNKKISGELNPSYKDLSSTAARLAKELKGMSEQDAGFAKKKAEAIAAQQALSNYGKELNVVKNGFKDMLTSAKGIAAGVLFAGGVQAIAQSLWSAMSGLVKFRNEFESSVKNLSAITGATGADLDFLKNASVELASTGSRSATEYVEAMKLIGSAKPELLKDKEALVEVTKAAALLSRASGIELPEASKRLTDALNQYGAPASEAAKYVDILAAASKYGAAEIPGITDALLEFGPVAKQSNIDMYESAAAIELLAEKGVKGAEAGTKLRNVFLTLSAVDSLPAQALEKLKQYGVNTSILSDKTLSLETRLTELSKVSGDANAMMQIFDKQNIVAGQIMLENIPRFAQLTEQVKEQGVANAQASVNTGTLASAWGKLVNSLKTLSLGVGLDWLKGIVSGAADAVTAFGKLTGVIQSNVVAMQDERQELQLNELRITSLNVGNAERTRLIQEMQNKYPEFLANLNAEKVSNEEISEAISKVNNSLLTKIALAQTQERMEDAAKDRSKAELKLADAQLEMEKQLAYLLNSRSIGANKYNKEQLEGMSVTMQAAQILSGNIRLQEVSTVSLADLASATANYNEQLANKNLSVEEYNKILADQMQVEAQLRKQLGITDTSSPSAAPAAVNGPNEEEKKAADALAAYLKKLREELRVERLVEGAKEIEVVRQKYAHERELAKGNKEALRIIDELEAYAIVDILKKTGKDFSDAQNSKLELTKATETEITEVVLTEQEKRAANAKTKAEELKQTLADITTGLQIFSAAGNFISTVFDGINQSENQELARDKHRNEEKAKNLKKQLDAKQISQRQYDQAISQMNEQQDAKHKEIARKQFERNKAIQIVQTIINTASAVVSALGTSGNIYAGIALAALAAATGAAQIGIIASSEAPEYGEGTEELFGPKHKSKHKGMPVINPETGETMALLEGGEAVIPADSAAANRGTIRALIAAKGRSIADKFGMARSNFNVERTSENIMYGNGGYINSQPKNTQSGVSSSSSDNMMYEMVKQNSQDIAALANGLKNIKVKFVKNDFDQFNEQVDNTAKRLTFDKR